MLDCMSSEQHEPGEPVRLYSSDARPWPVPADAPAAPPPVVASGPVGPVGLVAAGPTR